MSAQSCSRAQGTIGSMTVRPVLGHTVVWGTSWNSGEATRGPFRSDLASIRSLKSLFGLVLKGGSPLQDPSPPKRNPLIGGPPHGFGIGNTMKYVDVGKSSAQSIF